LKLEWRKTGEISWQEVSSSFYQYFSVSPILIDSNKIENINYLVVGKTLDEINDQNYGFPATDKIVIRNK
jgi:hypothetical protein